MPRLQRRARQRRDWPASAVLHLDTGIDFFGDGFEGHKHASDPPTDEMREAWEDLRDEVFARGAARGACERPWAWWQFEAPESRDPGIPEAEQLFRLGLLADDEIERRKAMELWPDGKPKPSPMFIRPWSWWRFVSPVERDYDVPEHEQLRAMPSEYLTEMERLA